MNEAGPICAVLAGGRGRRLGRPKAIEPLAGRPLISYPIAAAAEAGLETIVVAKPDSRLPALGVRVVTEPAQPRHPLCGLVAALRHGAGRPVIAVGCDMPLLNAALLALLATAEGSLVVCSAAGRPQPLLARYGAELAGSLEAAMGAGRSLTETVLELSPELLDEQAISAFGDPRRLSFNVNTADDLATAERLLATGA